MSRRKCCCTTTNTGSDLLCLNTEYDTPPSQWQPAQYRLSIGGFMPFKSCVNCYAVQQCMESGSYCTDADGCSSGLQGYAVLAAGACCADGPTQCGIKMELVTPTGGAYGAVIDFSSTLITDLDPNLPCTRFMPFTSFTTSTESQCYGNFDTVYWGSAYTGIRTCTQRIIDCTSNPPGRDYPCVDVCEIHLMFVGLFEHFHTDVLRCDPLQTYEYCDTWSIVAEAIYQRRKQSSDTWVAEGNYECVWSAVQFPGSDATCTNRKGCGQAGAMGMVPATVYVGKKP